jgi:hypothetical protein
VDVVEEMSMTCDEEELCSFIEQQGESDFVGMMLCMVVLLFI